ncbi:MAG: hypothetical protein ABII64_09490 [Elusimicrobiota bacterium]
MKKFIEDELEQCKRSFELHPDNSAAPERIGDIYEQLGLANLAKKYYEKALGIMKNEKLICKLRLLEISSDLAGVKGKNAVSILQACPRCEKISYKGQYRCKRCNFEYYSDYMKCMFAKIKVFIGDYEPSFILFAGIVFLPYYFLYGPLLYILLWAIWAPGIILGSKVK